MYFLRIYTKNQKKNSSGTFLIGLTKNPKNQICADRIVLPNIHYIIKIYKLYYFYIPYSRISYSFV